MPLDSIIFAYPLVNTYKRKHPFSIQLPNFFHLFSPSVLVKQKFTKRELLFYFIYICIKVHLIRKETLEGFAFKNANSRVPLVEFIWKVKNADWQVPADMKATFKNLDFLGNDSNRVIFNIGGNSFRMICKYAFGLRQVHLFICWLGTHAEYDKICNKNEQYLISNY